MNLFQLAITVFIATLAVDFMMMSSAYYLRRTYSVQTQWADAVQTARAAQSNEQAFAAAVNNISNALVESLDLQTVLSRILANLQEVVPYDSASVVILEDSRFRVASTQLNNPSVNHSTVDYIPEPIQSFLRQMQRSKAPRFVPFTALQPDWVVLAREEWVASHIGYPILIKGELAGVLNLNSTQPGFYQPEHLTQLGWFAKQAALALQNATLYSQVQAQAEELQARVDARTRELAQQNAYLQALIDNMSDGVIFIRAKQALIQYVNPAFTRITGLSAARVVGKDHRQFTAAMEYPDQFPQLVQSAIQTILTGEMWQHEFTVNAPHGKIACIAIVTPVKGANQELLGYLILLRDITKVKALEAQKDAFIANASHELRNPVQNFKTRLYLLRKQPERADDHLTVIEAAATRISRLIENLLDLSRFQHGQIKLKVANVDLAEQVAAIVEEYDPLAEERQISIKMVIGPELSLIEGDSTRLSQVISNLLSNALNYTPDSGHITVLLQRASGVEGEGIRLAVQDTGHGISPEALPHIFEPFYRADGQKIKGNGLGLTIIKEIVDLHYGHISVESQIGVGTTFWVWLPLRSTSH